MTPMDWQDMPQRLTRAEDKVKALTIEVEALRQIVVEQALELKRCRDGMALSRGTSGQTRMEQDTRWQSPNNS